MTDRESMPGMPSRFSTNSGSGGATPIGMYMTTGDTDTYPSISDNATTFPAEQMKQVTFPQDEPGDVSLSYTFSDNAVSQMVYNVALNYIPNGTQIFVWSQGKYYFTYWSSIGLQIMSYNTSGTQNVLNPLGFNMPTGTAVAVLGNQIISHETLRFMAQAPGEITPGTSGMMSAIGANGPLGLNSVTVQDPGKFGATANAIAWVSWGWYQTAPNTAAKPGWVLEDSGCMP